MERYFCFRVGACHSIPTILFGIHRLFSQQLDSQPIEALNCASFRRSFSHQKDDACRFAQLSTPDFTDSFTGFPLDRNLVRLD